MADKKNVKTQLKTEAVNATVDMLKAHIADMQELQCKAKASINYLTDDENMSGSSVAAYKEKLENLLPVLDRAITKFEAYRDLSQAVINVFESGTVRTNRSFAEARDAVQVVQGKMSQVGK